MELDCRVRKEEKVGGEIKLRRADEGKASWLMKGKGGEGRRSLQV